MKGWSDMKQFLFILLVLGIAIPASAEVAVYNLKASSTGFGYKSDSLTWGQIKDSNTAFMILEEPTDGNTNVWVVTTWKGKDKKNYIMAENLGTLKFEQPWLAKKDMWIITGADKNGRIILTGDAKMTMVGKPSKKSCVSASCHTSDDLAYLGPVIDDTFAASLTGYAIADETDKNGNRTLCTTTLSLKLNTVWTLNSHPYIDTAEEEVDMIRLSFSAAGYTDVTEP
jgi:hypothetical protein